MKTAGEKMHSIQPPVKSSKMFQCSCERKRKGVSKNIELKLPDILEENNTRGVEKIQIKYNTSTKAQVQLHYSTIQVQTSQELRMLPRSLSVY